MASYKTYYKGDDIIIPFKAWKDIEKTQAIDLDSETVEIQAEVYTSPNDKKTFWKNAGTGRTLLHKVSATEYDIILDSSVTALMKQSLIVVKLIFTFTNTKLSDSKQDLTVSLVYGELTSNKTSNSLTSVVKTSEGDTINIVFTGLDINAEIIFTELGDGDEIEDGNYLQD